MEGTGRNISYGFLFVAYPLKGSEAMFDMSVKS